MLTPGLVILGFVVVALLLHAVWGRSSRTKSQRAEAIVEDLAAIGGELVPASLHPKIDPDRCIGSGGCVVACPEHDVIGLVRGRGELINPLGCIGHGACAAGCPVDAIELVFGTQDKGVDIPLTSEDFQTNQPGVFIVGELGGMGLIRNAVSQGRQAAQFILQNDRRGGGDVYDAIVVGAGPAGISATLQLMQGGLRVLMLEREEFGGTIAHYPRAKVVMTGHLDFAIIGKVKRRRMSKEELVELWQDIRRRTNLSVTTGELVRGLMPTPQGPWRVVSSTRGAAKQERLAANVVLALGRRGSPRKLGVPGEELAKVAYRLIEPESFADQHVLVVGGGNSAAECALALGEAGLSKSVTLSYRKPELARVRREVRDKIDHAINSGTVTAHMPSEVDSIAAHSVSLRSNGSTFDIQNDAVIVQIGGTPPSALLDRFGIHTITKRGEA